MTIGSLIQLPFLFALFINPESWPGGPPPLFADRLPGLGILFDAIAVVFGTAGEANYEIFFTSGLIFGLYIEVVVASAIIFGIGTALTKEMGHKSADN